MIPRRVSLAFRRYGPFVFLFAPLLALGQTLPDDGVQDVEVCAVLKNPGNFDQQIIRLHGRLEFEFEDDHVDDAACELPLLHPTIWWTYGGESVFGARQDAKYMRALTSPVLRDAQFYKFQEQALARRSKRPDGEACNTHRECANYDVVATFTGRFFARRLTPGRPPSSSFGHLGCCHLFVIEQIADVAAKRTSVPDGDQSFSCSNETWQSEYPTLQMPGLDERSTMNQQFIADQMRAHGDGSLVEAMAPSPSWSYAAITGSLIWSSPDLLTTYTAKSPQSPLQKKVKKQQTDPAAVPVQISVTKEHCEPVTN